MNTSTCDLGSLECTCVPIDDGRPWGGSDCNHLLSADREN